MTDDKIREVASLDDAIEVCAKEADRAEATPGWASDRIRRLKGTLRLAAPVVSAPDLDALRWREDRCVTNHFGERVWLKAAHSLDGQRIGITECCKAVTPCTRHAPVVSALDLDALEARYEALTGTLDKEFDGDDPACEVCGTVMHANDDTTVWQTDPGANVCNDCAQSFYVEFYSVLAAFIAELRGMRLRLAATVCGQPVAPSADLVERMCAAAFDAYHAWYEGVAERGCKRWGHSEDEADRSVWHAAITAAIAAMTAPAPAPAPSWQREPPTEPGWYWRIRADGRWQGVALILVIEDDLPIDQHSYIRWWPVPIVPPSPPTEAP